jgi:hypothetical protein
LVFPSADTEAGEIIPAVVTDRALRKPGDGRFSTI